MEAQTMKICMVLPLFLVITTIEVKTNAPAIGSGHLHRVILDKRSSARFLEGGRFRRDGEEQDREETDENPTKESGPSQPIHPCFNTTTNHSVTTPHGEDVLCLVPSKETLMKKLEAAGGYNRHYVAASEEEVNAYFEDPFDTLAKSQNYAGPGYDWTGNNGLNYTGKRRRSITDRNLQKGEGGKRDRIKRATLTIGLQTCVNAEQRTEQGLIALCTECWWINQLTEDKFPRLLNELICGTDGTSSSPPSEFCNINWSGRCVQRSMTQDFLTRTDRYSLLVPSPDPQYTLAYVQEWELYSQPIRSCCQCQNFF